MSRSFEGFLVDTLATESYLAVCDRLQPGDHPERRRFTTPRGADDDDELAIVDVEVEFFDRDDRLCFRVEHLRYLIEFESCHGFIT